MKEEILAEIENIKSALKYPIYYLQDRLNDTEHFNYYWDALEFINWVKTNHPQEYEDYGLENHYQQIIDFGYFYVKAFNPQPTPIVYEDGILGINTPIEEMISQLYQHVVKLTDEEIVNLKVVFLDCIKFAHDTAPKIQLMENANASLNDLAIPRIEAKIDTLVSRINPISQYKTKKEEMEARVKAEIAKELLKK